MSLKRMLIERIKELAEPLSPISIDHATSLKKLSGIKCVAFDFYGTMFISGVGDIGIDEDREGESEEIFRNSLEAAGFTVNDVSAGTYGLQVLEKTLARHKDEAKERGIAYPEPEIREVWKDTLKEMAEQSMISGSVDESSIAKFAVEFEFRINAVWPVPNLAGILTNLKKQGLELAIISNSQFYTPLAFEAIIGQSPENFGFNKDLLVWSYKCGRKKPDTDFYADFVNRIQEQGMDPTEVLYVGNDINKDIKPAKYLGMHTALFVGDSRSIRHEELELKHLSLSPDLVIDRLSQIHECLI
ncbi:MAG TPA: HAD hydrolase-like protein [Halalkalibaculum sp.]|nr:HAD hydrolase-like protein [Halalkalibaculum sp.]